MSNDNAPNLEWVNQVFKTIDAQDAQGFAKYFMDDGMFVFGSFPAAQGTQAISEFVAYFFSTIKSLSHELQHINEVNGVHYIHFDVTYEVIDGRTVTISGLETIEMLAGLISKYVIYMDPTPLQKIQIAA